MPWTEQEALAWYLEKYPDGRLGAPISTFWAGLRDARNTTGRSERTGLIESPENTGTWLGAIGYLCFMDQVGTAVELRPRGRPPNPKNYMQVPIARCLRNFAPRALTERTIQALYALRCSLAHNFSLFNEGKGKWAKELTFHFGLRADDSSPLVQHATRRWEGGPGAARRSTRTWVNLEALGDLAEGCAGNVIKAFDAGQLASRLPADKLVERYTFTMWEDTSP